MSYDEFLRFIFPEGMFDYFELPDFKEKPEQVEIYFEEKDVPLKEYAAPNSFGLMCFGGIGLRSGRFPG